MHKTEVSNIRYMHLTIEKLSQIEALRKEGDSFSWIVSLISVYYITIIK